MSASGGVLPVSVQLLLLPLYGLKLHFTNGGNGTPTGALPPLCRQGPAPSSPYVCQVRNGCRGNQVAQTGSVMPSGPCLLGLQEEDRTMHAGVWRPNLDDCTENAGPCHGDTLMPGPARMCMVYPYSHEEKLSLTC